MATTSEIEAYLGEVRQLLRGGQAVFVMRPKNLEALLSLGMSKRSALVDVGRLTKANYCDGPQEDRDRSGQQCWIFGFELGDEEVYVKLVIEALSQGRRRLKVLSFHQAEWPLSYPFR